MKKYVFTSLSQNYWNLWGESWIASLLELGGHSNIIVFNAGLYDQPKNKLISSGVQVIDFYENKDLRNNAFLGISKYSKDNPNCLFAYWDLDVYFQRNISDLWQEIEDSFIVSENLDGGFIAGPSFLWSHITFYKKIIDKFENKTSLFDFVLQNSYCKTVSDAWNFIDLLKIKNEDLIYGNVFPYVIHPVGLVKKTILNHNILFWEKHKEIYNEFHQRNLRRPILKFKR